MPKSAADPIVAAATPPGAAARAVLRLSGIGLLNAADDLLPEGCPRPEGRRGAHTGRFRWMPGAEVEVDLLVFPGPASATGEDVLELHIPGSQPVVDALLEGILARGARLAEPGEFTRRAFRNGRLDLTQAEAVHALVSAGGAAEARAAAELLGGALGACMQRTRDALTAALTELEAGLDFEEGDSQDLAPGEVAEGLAAAQDALRGGLEGERRRTLEHTGSLRIGLFGPANAGKTSLVEALCGDAGLVSPTAGTTRDWLETRWQPAGRDQPWILVDGPGLDAGGVDARDRAARRSALDAVPRVGLWWRCEDPTAADPTLGTPSDAPVLQVWTKADLGGSVPADAPGALRAVRVSAGDGSGLDALIAETAAVMDAGEQERAARASGSVRHRAALEEALEAVDRAATLDAEGGLQDLVAEELRRALHALSGLVGEWTPEDLLDRLFASFCVGK